jgi:hypothetical protein
MSWESIEFLFRPATMLELLLRMDLAGMQQKIYEWVGDDGPDACPHRFRSEPFSAMLRQLHQFLTIHVLIPIEMVSAFAQTHTHPTPEYQPPTPHNPPIGTTRPSHPSHWSR